MNKLSVIAISLLGWFSSSLTGNELDLYKSKSYTKDITNRNTMYEILNESRSIIQDTPYDINKGLLVLKNKYLEGYLEFKLKNDKLVYEYFKNKHNLIVEYLNTEYKYNLKKIGER